MGQKGGTNPRWRTTTTSVRMVNKKLLLTCCGIDGDQIWVQEITVRYLVAVIAEEGVTGMFYCYDLS